MQHIIRAEGLIKTYGGVAARRRVLDGVSVDLGRGEFIAVMGPSGSGKTTLLFALSGMDRPDGGRIEFDGQDLSSLGERALADLRRKRMGFVFQQPSMLKHLNILDNVILAALHDRRGQAARLSAKARSLMEGAGIAELAERDVSQVSGGQLQRAGICRALMNDPLVVFGDEPTGALNSSAAEGVLEMLRKIHAGGTAIALVSHDARVAARAERVLFMRDGAFVAEERLGTFAGTGLEGRVDAVTAHMRALGI
ncbi:MAG: ABC transporter ATP-binding protein [Spirochaetae bacterium HGW-Spirochaetae-3]|jgi:putative ABC transport system ATP-binding protein|nr:MAG: ABC transporter ATP-binding protein [Spirochaetae bacterium HGW-Spirochaetae-3]